MVRIKGGICKVNIADVCMRAFDKLVEKYFVLIGRIICTAATAL
jgi:hypothetical protein